MIGRNKRVSPEDVIVTEKLIQQSNKILIVSQENSRAK
jgi:hypothetical protein